MSSIASSAACFTASADVSAALLTASTESFPAFTAASTEQALRAFGEAQNIGIGAMVHPVRVAVSGSGEGPGLFEMLALLGRKRVCARLRGAERALAGHAPVA